MLGWAGGLLCGPTYNKYINLNINLTFFKIRQKATLPNCHYVDEIKVNKVRTNDLIHNKCKTIITTYVIKGDQQASNPETESLRYRSQIDSCISVR